MVDTHMSAAAPPLRPEYLRDTVAGGDIGVVRMPRQVALVQFGEQIEVGALNVARFSVGRGQVKDRRAAGA